MKRFIALVAMCLFAVSPLLGCGDRMATKKETKITTPGGTTTTTTEQEVKKTGDNPPPAQP